MNFKKAFKSFGFAIKGLRWLVAFENNFQIHLLATAIVMLAGLYFKIRAEEWLVLTLVIGLVWSAEAFNTAIEKLCDFVQPQHDAHIGRIKDLAAAGVFIMAIVAVVVGLIIFVPKILIL